MAHQPVSVQLTHLNRRTQMALPEMLLLLEEIAVRALVTLTTNKPPIQMTQALLCCLAPNHNV